MSSSTPRTTPNNMVDHPGPDLPAPHWFQAFATHASNWTGSRWAFLIAVGAIVAWAVTGPWFHYSDTWQLVINTVSSVVTFLMVFLIQNTQNRDAKAIHLKLDEIIRAIHPAREELMSVEKLSDEDLNNLSAHYEQIRTEVLRRKRNDAA